LRPFFILLGTVLFLFDDFLRLYYLFPKT
jgi:hypothetical protein